MAVEQIAGLLSGLWRDFNDEDLRDMLWLAPHLGAAAAAEAPPGLRGKTPAQPAVPVGPEPGPPVLPRPNQPRGSGRHQRDTGHDPAYSVHLPPLGASATEGGALAATMRAPTPAALADQLALSRAMRPLNRTVPSRHHVLLDEEATVNRIAEEQLWLPVLKPAPARWLELALVVDRYESMSIWRRPIAELQGLLERLGAFSDVRLWMLDQDANQPERLGVRRQPGAPLRSPRELVHPEARRVIVVVSDCLSPMWKSAAVGQVLADWARRGPVAIFQPLPQRLWAYSHARPVPARLYAREPAGPNKYYGCGTQVDSRSVPIPVLQIDPMWLTSWSRLLSASGTGGVDAMVLFAGGGAVDGGAPAGDGQPAADGLAPGSPEVTADSTPPAQLAEDPRTAAARRRREAQQRLERFRATASPEAVQLAQYLSAAPISLPVIRLIQDVMMPGTSQFALAEVFLGGLLCRLDGQQSGIDPDELQYDFWPEVRPLLLRRLRKKEALRVLRDVSDYVGARFGQARDFGALLAGADLHGDLLIGPDSRPFARVAAEVLRLLGGQYVETATRLSAALGDGDSSVAAAVGLSTKPPGPVGADDAQFREALAGISLTDRRDSRRPLACPYCYHAFVEKEILFRCSGRAPFGHTACAPELDELLRDQMGERGLQPPVFRADARRDEATCPRCGSMTRIQVCPGCHSRLPAMFRAVQGRLIALVGSSQAGKTAFMTVLIHELRHRVGELLESSTTGADDSTQERYTSAYEWRLYKNSELSFHHPVAAGQYISPLVFRFAMNRRTRFRPNSREVLLSFADSAGEDLVSPNKVELMARYLAAADAVFVLLDPLRLPDVRQRVSRHIPLPKPERPNDEVVASFNRITSLLLAGTGQQRVDKPVALILSKVDALGHLMEPDSPLRRPNPPQPYFDEADNLAVQEQVRTLLAGWGAAGLDETVRKHYSRCRYFGISALGATPTEDNRVRDAGPRPYRATEPFMWVLNQFDLVKAQ